MSGGPPWGWSSWASSWVPPCRSADVPAGPGWAGRVGGGSGQARTLDDILAEAGGPEIAAFEFGEDPDDPPVGLGEPDASGIGSLVARLNRRAGTLAVIDEAAARVGAPARLMRAIASLESSLDATARASTSSATGLYQFIEATWLSKVRTHGRKYGLGHLARHIRRGPLGEPVVDDPRIREQILALREDVRLSAFLAAELTVDNRRRLQKLMARPVTQTETYLAHVFGVAGTARFLKAAESTPDRVGASVFPKEARANPGLFRMGGQPATLGRSGSGSSRRCPGSTSPIGWPPSTASLRRGRPRRSRTANWPGWRTGVTGGARSRSPRPRSAEVPASPRDLTRCGEQGGMTE